jgi:nucleoprotein TPR
MIFPRLVSSLAAACNHIRQFNEISHTSEEALASLNTTHDEYKSTTEAQLTASYVCSLCSFVGLMSTHSLSAGHMKPFKTSKNVETRTCTIEDISCQDQTYIQDLIRIENAREEWQADKSTLEGAIVDMTDAEKNLSLAGTRGTRQSLSK